MKLILLCRKLCPKSSPRKNTELSFQYAGVQTERLLLSLMKGLKSAFLWKFGTASKHLQSPTDYSLSVWCLRCICQWADVRLNVKIVFITSCTFRILEPLDQCLNWPFKKTSAKLMYNVVLQNLTKIPLPEDLSAWDSYTITDAVFLMKEALDILTEPFVNVTLEIWLERVKYLSVTFPEDRLFGSRTTYG